VPRGHRGACVEGFPKAGDRVRILVKDTSALERGICDLDRVSCHALDITDETAVEAHIEPHGSMAACSMADFRTALEIIVTGAFLITHAGVREALDASRALSIIAISSVISSLASAPKRLAYATSKAALIGFAKSVTLDFIRDDIRRNVICPGNIDTPSLRWRIAAGAREDHGSGCPEPDILVWAVAGAIGAS